MSDRNDRDSATNLRARVRSFFTSGPAPLARPRGSGQRAMHCQFEQLEQRQLLAQMVADFSLVDVNASSSTYLQQVSPRDFVGQVSGWYFGAAT